MMSFSLDNPGFSTVGEDMELVMGRLLPHNILLALHPQLIHREKLLVVAALDVMGE